MLCEYLAGRRATRQVTIQALIETLLENEERRSVSRKSRKTQSRRWCHQDVARVADRGLAT